MTRRGGVGAALALCLLATGCDGLSKVRGIEKSMEPTIRSGEIITLQTGAYDTEAPQIGDIISFRAPAGAGVERCGVERSPRQPCPQPVQGEGEDSYMKRIVARPGDRVAIRDHGHAVVNGTRLAEPYIQPCMDSFECDFPDAVTVPPGHYFVLGDNRGYSSDSRYWGPVPRASIEGRVDPPDPSRR